MTGKVYTFNVEPNTKPRMTRSDKWKQRPCVMKYRLFKDKLKLEAKRLGYKVGGRFEINFDMPMPESWSKKEKSLMIYQPHTQAPDLDNMIKAFLDALCDDDSFVHTVNASKKWHTVGQIWVVQNEY